MKCKIDMWFLSYAVLGLLLIQMKSWQVFGSPVVPDEGDGGPVVTEYLTPLAVEDFTGAADVSGPEDRRLVSPHEEEEEVEEEEEQKEEGVVYLESLDEGKLETEEGPFHVAQVLGFMMDLLQREVEGSHSDSDDEGMSSMCATPCGRGQGLINVPLCFSCVGLVNAHIKPISISRKNR